jgi:hypothetical protein
METKAEEETAVAPVKVGKYSRNRSIMSMTNNPFEAAAASADLHVEVLTDATLISEDDFRDIILGPLKTTRYVCLWCSSCLDLLTCIPACNNSNNEERLSMLEGLRQPYLFSSTHLESLCGLTTSLKTKMEFIKQIGPRLIDPAGSTSKFLDMFRFVEEKMQVEQILKDRNSTLSKTQLANTRRTSNILSSRAGRGAGGRGARTSITTNSPEGTNTSTTSSNAPSAATTESPVKSSDVKTETKPAARSSMSSLFGFADEAQVVDNLDDLLGDVGVKCTVAEST